MEPRSSAGPGVMMKTKGKRGLQRFPGTTALAGRGEPGKLGRQQQGEDEVAMNRNTKHN